MLSRKIILASVASWGLMFGFATDKTVAAINHEVSTTEFRPIQQPLSIKGAVTIGGLGLIGLELWWFLVKKTKP
ncbi:MULTISPECIES: hypothetical protein [unclassified Anabaena]|uniref:hypothetical protein n=1 Tax=unclassified Anabaena TaxID=2619674 RepID=UPI00083743AE|nr:MULTISPECIES: hypothetical protein [unclassified Anabaena]